METKLIKKELLPGIVRGLAEDTLVYAPVQEEDNIMFRVLEKDMEPILEFANTKNAPKNFFFPQAETMMRFLKKERGAELLEVPIAAREAVLFGVRPCDARSFVLLDYVFDDPKYRDPYYVERRAKTTIVSIACVRPPYSTCFCTSVGGHPMSKEGADLSLVDMGDTWLAEAVTEKGEKLLQNMGDLPGADEAAVTRKNEMAEKAAEVVKADVPASAIKPWLDENFDHDFWNKIHIGCLACGTCTYLCPTCHCFDITDEMKKEEGRRARSWDSCMYWLFTQETSGHNPRPTQKERWRQRFMHKFKYFVDNFGAVACVGCGRCVRYCPVNIDIRKIAQDISKL